MMQRQVLNWIPTELLRAAINDINNSNSPLAPDHQQLFTKVLAFIPVQSTYLFENKLVGNKVVGSVIQTYTLSDAHSSSSSVQTHIELQQLDSR